MTRPLFWHRSARTPWRRPHRREVLEAHALAPLDAAAPTEADRSEREAEGRQHVLLDWPVPVLASQVSLQDYVAMHLKCRPYVIDCKYKEPCETDVHFRVARAFREHGIAPPPCCVARSNRGRPRVAHAKLNEGAEPPRGIRSRRRFKCRVLESPRRPPAARISGSATSLSARTAAISRSGRSDSPAGSVSVARFRRKSGRPMVPATAGRAFVWPPKPSRWRRRPGVPVVT